MDPVLEAIVDGVAIVALSGVISVGVIGTVAGVVKYHERKHVRDILMPG